MENFQNYAFVIDKPNQPKPGFTKPLVIKKSADRQSEKSDIKFFIDPILKHVSDHLKLQELNCELTEQLTHVGLLLQKHRERLRYEQEENKKHALAEAEKARREQEVKMER